MVEENEILGESKERNVKDWSRRMHSHVKQGHRMFMDLFPEDDHTVESHCMQPNQHYPESSCQEIAQQEFVGINICAFANSTKNRSTWKKNMKDKRMMRLCNSDKIKDVVEFSQVLVAF